MSKLTAVANTTLHTTTGSYQPARFPRRKPYRSTRHRCPSLLDKIIAEFLVTRSLAAHPERLPVTLVGHRDRRIATFQNQLSNLQTFALAMLDVLSTESFCIASLFPPFGNRSMRKDAKRTAVACSSREHARQISHMHTSV